MRVSAHVEIIAHRGASRDRLENTMAAFSAGLEQGADALELDVHATRDGVVVVHHDPEVSAGAITAERATGAERVKGAEGDTGPNGRRLIISAVDYTTLNAVRLRNGEPLPTLDEVLRLAAGKATVYVEVKGFGIEAQVIACLNRHADTQTAVHSFDHRISHNIGTHNALTPIGILSASYVLDLEHMINAAGARDLWQQAALIDQKLIDTAHSVGARVIAWTENDVQHAAKLVQMGVDAICTDTPQVMREGLLAAGLLHRSLNP